jgi:hypothetical protein
VDDSGLESGAKTGSLGSRAASSVPRPRVGRAVGRTRGRGNRRLCTAARRRRDVASPRRAPPPRAPAHPRRSGHRRTGGGPRRRRPPPGPVLHPRSRTGGGRSRLVAKESLALSCPAALIRHNVTSAQERLAKQKASVRQIVGWRREELAGRSSDLLMTRLATQRLLHSWGGQEPRHAHCAVRVVQTITAAQCSPADMSAHRAR